MLIKDGNKTLERYIDYMVMYFSNVNVGTGKITVEFYGNYKGKQTVSFVINPANSRYRCLKQDTRAFLWILCRKDLQQAMRSSMAQDLIFKCFYIQIHHQQDG